MKGSVILCSLVAILAMAFSYASAYDPSPLQDFCVAINDTKNGGTCLSIYIYYGNTYCLLREGKIAQSSCCTIYLSQLPNDPGFFDVCISSSAHLTLFQTVAKHTHTHHTHVLLVLQHILAMSKCFSFCIFHKFEE